MDNLNALRQDLLRAIRALKVTVTNHTANIAALADAVTAVNAKTQRTGAVITGPVSIGSQDVTVTWPTPWPDTAYAVIIELQSGTAALGNLHATVKAGTKTTVDCVVTVAAAAVIAANVGVDVVGIRT